MSATYDAVKGLVNPQRSEGVSKRYLYRERYGEFVVFDWKPSGINNTRREIATCNRQDDAQDIVDALNLLFEKEGKK